MSAVAQKSYKVEEGAYPEDGMTRTWTRDEYYHLAEAGILGPEERVELIEGEIVQRVSPIGAPHVTAVSKTAQVLGQLFGAGNTTRVQSPLTLSDRSEPEPDVLVAKGRIDDYADHHPSAAEVVLLVEVADATLKYDWGRKAGLYARAGIKDYWVLNLIDRCLEVHRKPSPNGYRSVEIFTEPDLVVPLSAPGMSIKVADLLPPGDGTVRQANPDSV